MTDRNALMELAGDELVDQVARAIFDAQHPTSDPTVREQYCQSSRYKRAASAAIATIRASLEVD